MRVVACRSLTLQVEFYVLCCTLSLDVQVCVDWEASDIKISFTRWINISWNNLQSQRQHFIRRLNKNFLLSPGNHEKFDSLSPTQLQFPLHFPFDLLVLVRIFSFPSASLYSLFNPQTYILKCFSLLSFFPTHFSSHPRTLHSLRER